MSWCWLLSFCLRSNSILYTQLCDLGTASLQTTFLLCPLSPCYTPPTEATRGRLGGWGLIPSTSFLVGFLLLWEPSKELYLTAAAAAAAAPSLNLAYSFSITSRNSLMQPPDTSTQRCGSESPGCLCKARHQPQPSCVPFSKVCTSTPQGLFPSLQLE